VSLIRLPGGSITISLESTPPSDRLRKFRTVTENRESREAMFERYRTLGALLTVGVSLNGSTGPRADLAGAARRDAAVSGSTAAPAPTVRD
jgi:hypothetical protein